MGNGLAGQDRRLERPRQRNLRNRAERVDNRPNSERRPNGDGNNRASRRNSRRQDIAFLFKDDYDDGERRPRISPALGYANFWESPSEAVCYLDLQVFPIVWPHGLWREGGEDDQDYDSPESYPRFLTPFLNQDLRLFIKLDGTSNSTRTLELYPEYQYVTRNFKYLKVNFMRHPLDGKVRVAIEENHGNKRKKKSRFRPLYPRTILLDHINQTIGVGGDEFFLCLHPPNPLHGTMHFPDGNGEIPKLIGTYCRELDTCPDITIEWKVSLYHWYNQTDDYKLQADE